MAIAPSACSSQCWASPLGGDGLHQLDGRSGELPVREQLLERRAALGQGALQQRLVLAGEQVEDHVDGGRLDGQALDARGGRVDALAERVEVLAAVRAANDDLAVEHITAGGQDQLGEVAPEWLGRARLEEHLLAVDEREAAKAVELDLVGEVLADGQRLARERKLGLDRRLQGQCHRALRAAGSAPAGARSSACESAAARARRRGHRARRARRAPAKPSDRPGARRSPRQDRRARAAAREPCRGAARRGRRRRPRPTPADMTRARRERRGPSRPRRRCGRARSGCSR